MKITEYVVCGNEETCRDCDIDTAALVSAIEAADPTAEVDIDRTFSAWNGGKFSSQCKQLGFGMIRFGVVCKGVKSETEGGEEVFALFGELSESEQSRILAVIH